MTAASPAEVWSSDRVGSIDSLRCFAMTAVVAQHSGLLPFGWIGVWLFFVISGYVVTVTVLRRRSRTAARSGLADFYRRRAERIIPIYYAYVLAGIATLLLAGASFDPLAAASLLGFFNNIAMALSRGELAGWPGGHLWTISVEMQFYCIYGIVLFRSSRKTTLTFLLAALIVAPVLRFLAALVIGLQGWGSEASAFAIYSGSFLHADAFAAGALLAFAAQSSLLFRIARPVMLLGLVLLVTYAAAYIAINRFLVQTHGIDTIRCIVSGIMWGQYREVFVYSAVVAFCAGVVALAATGDPSLDWLLRHRPLQRIGEISYGAYVYHAAALPVAGRLVAQVHKSDWNLDANLELFVLGYAITLVAAELSYRCFESAFRNGRA